MRTYCVYILGSATGTLYVGVTNNLARRLSEHRDGNGKSFTSRYKVHRLLYHVAFTHPKDAITREKQIKGWLRAKKLALIQTTHSGFADLADQVLP